MAKSRIKREINTEAGSVKFTEIATEKFVEASIDGVFGEGTLARLRETDEKGMLVRTLLHGFNAKFGDSAADPNEDAITVIKETIEQVAGGQWATRTAGSGGSKTTILTEALMRVTNQTEEQVNTKLADMTDEQTKELKKHPQIKAAIDKINLERAAERAKASAEKVSETEALSF